MKKILFFILITTNCFCQTKPSTRQSSSIELKGNNNTIKVIQGDGIKVYNLDNENQYNDFLSYLKNIPKLNNQLKNILSYNIKIFELVNQLVKSSQDLGIFEPTIFLEKFAEKVEENTKLKIEIENLRKQITDIDLLAILDKANTFLDKFDDLGYQKLLEDFKVLRRNKITSFQKEISLINYLQAKNNLKNDKFELALNQINDALRDYPSNYEYLLLLGEIYYENSEYDLALFPTLKAHNLAKLDSSKIENTEMMNFIGTIYQKKGNLDSALFFYEKSISQSIKITTTDFFDKKDNPNRLNSITKDRKSVAKSFSNMGLIYNEKGDYEKALSYQIIALGILETILEKDALEIAIVNNNIGGIHMTKKDYKKALEYFIISKTAKESSMGLNHSQTAFAYANIGNAYEKLQDYKNALVFYQKSLTINEKIFSNNHIIIGANYLDIGITQIKLGEQTKAVTSFKKIEKFENNDYAKAEWINSEGVNEFKSGRYESSISLYSAALYFFEQTKKSKTDVLNIILIQNLAKANCYLGNKKEALTLFKKAIDLGKQAKIKIDRILTNYQECKEK